MPYKFYVLKQVFYFIILFNLPVFLFAQQKDSLIKDSLLLTQTDSLIPKTADSAIQKKDSIQTALLSPQISLKDIIKENKNLNSTGKPIAMANNERKPFSQDVIFYTLLATIAILAFLRFFYIRYFNNLFRVFFNTSLRQSQLTDQLLQAKLPSLFFNLIATVSFGLFIYFVLKYFDWVKLENPLILTLICTLAISVIYLLKFITLKFTGWVTGYNDVTNMYIFIIFLINKILGIILLPLIIIMAFAAPALVKAAVLIAALLTIIMFLLRFLRSYGLLQHLIKISRLHFFMYIIGIEIVPVLLIYKGLMLLLSKNL